jgi:hypothetical protein
MLTETPSAQSTAVASERTKLVNECMDWIRSRAVPGSFLTRLPPNLTPEQTEQAIKHDAMRVFGAAIILHKAGVKNILYWLRCVYRINDTYALHSELPLELAKRQPTFDHAAFDLYEVDFDGKRIDPNAGFDQPPLFKSVCVMGRKDTTPQTFYWSLEDCVRTSHFKLAAPKAGGDDLARTPAGRAGSRRQFEHGAFTGGCWAAYGRRMMQMRAIGLAIKNVFPGALEGVQILEYDLDTMPGFRSPIMAQKQQSPANMIAGRTS